MKKKISPLIVIGVLVIALGINYVSNVQKARKEKAIQEQLLQEKLKKEKEIHDKVMKATLKSYNSLQRKKK